MKGLDFAWGLVPGHERAFARAIKKQGFGFVVRYLSHEPSKNLTRAEIHAYRAEGIEIVTVWEDAATGALGGSAQGIADARAAKALLHTLGAPDHAPVFFACDFPVTPEQMPVVDAYLDATAFVLTEAENGVYGDYAVVSRAQHIRYRWETSAWSAGAWSASAGMRQYAQGGVTDGVQWDLDVSLAGDFGAWRWHDTPDTPIPPKRHPVRKATKKAAHATKKTVTETVKTEPVLTAGTGVGVLGALAALLHTSLGLDPTWLHGILTALPAVGALLAALRTRPAKVTVIAGALGSLATACAAFGLHLPATLIGWQMPIAALIAGLLMRGAVSPRDLPDLVVHVVTSAERPIEDLIRHYTAAAMRAPAPVLNPNWPAPAPTSVASGGMSTVAVPYPASPQGGGTGSSGIPSPGTAGGGGDSTAAVAVAAPAVSQTPAAAVTAEVTPAA